MSTNIQSIPTGRPVVVYLHGLDFPLTLILDHVSPEYISGTEVMSMVTEYGVVLTYEDVRYDMSQVAHIHIPYLN